MRKSKREERDLICLKEHAPKGKDESERGIPPHSIPFLTVSLHPPPLCSSLGWGAFEGGLGVVIFQQTNSPAGPLSWLKTVESFKTGQRWKEEKRIVEHLGSHLSNIDNEKKEAADSHNSCLSLLSGAETSPKKYSQRDFILQRQHALDSLRRIFF
ncbi:hypothetical protein CDAR_214211 [Caerostris darwini]|uniref:Uncharacterized protein n=1 Tax=Caerostris darwini TaxID=1538125 RepID=A0AAV4S442_9ARAC|nr:hypothetical protein CDAR_214211 [Caerostris darwini]